MTDAQRRMAVSLSLCTFVPGIPTKRFARDMAFAAVHSPDVQLTEKQDKYLREAVIKFRRQIPADVVALAVIAKAAA